MQVFTLEAHQMYSVNTTLENFENTTVRGDVILDFCLSKTRAGECHYYGSAIVSEKLLFDIVLRPH